MYEEKETYLGVPLQSVSPPRKKTLIKVTGTLMIIFGILFFLFAGSRMVNLFVGSGRYLIDRNIFIVFNLFFLFVAVLTGFLGFFGIKKFINTEIAYKLFPLGIVHLILCMITVILCIDNLGGAIRVFGVFGGLGLPFSILYIIGGYMNRKEMQ
jgi:hypothetical protein